MTFSFDAYVTTALFDRLGRAVFALGDGTVRFESGESVVAHDGAVCWPFAGATGPMGKQAAEIGYDDAALSTRIAAAPDKTWLATGLDDGRVWAANVTGERIVPLKAEKGAAISALAMSLDGKCVAWGDEDGHAGVVEIDDA